VENQPPPLEYVNAYESDTVLKEAVAREGGAWANDNLSALGGKVFDPEWIEKAHLANRIVPELRRFDRFGQRVDTVEFHPAWHSSLRCRMNDFAFRHTIVALRNIVR
jgi:putative acyl-CoA dehydrogenase